MKHETLNSKQAIKIKRENSKLYDLEDRTLEFAKQVRTFVKGLPRNLANREDSVQLIRSSGSIGANYIEANEALSKRDFVHRIRICRKESKESAYWLRLIETGGSPGLEERRKKLIKEATELMMIFSAIMRKSQ